MAKHTQGEWEHSHTVAKRWDRDCRRCALNEVAPEMLEALKDSTAWIAKLIADRPDNDPTGVKDRAKRHLERLQDLIAKATTEG